MDNAVKTRPLYTCMCIDIKRYYIRYISNIFVNTIEIVLKKVHHFYHKYKCEVLVV